MALSRVKTWSVGEDLNASDLNSEFDNILNNPVSLISPITAAFDFDGVTITLDSAAVTQLVSSSAASLIWTAGPKAGTPSTSGSIERFSAQTFTDSNTAGSGTATAHVFLSIAQPTLAATNASVVTTDAATFYIANAPAAGTNETITSSWALWTDDGKVRHDLTGTVVSAAGAVLRGLYLPAVTETVTGSTNITTATGFNLVEIGIPTISAASALTVTNAATLYISGAPAGGGAGPATITNAYALWVDAGAARFDGTVFLASGGLISWESGNAVLTHSSGILTVSTGDLRVTTAGTNTASAVTVGGTQTLTGKTLGAVTLSGTVTGGAQSLSNLGTTYIGDTSNANNTLGLTINQGASDDEILSLKSSDVTHGVTTITETDTFGVFAKATGTQGGLLVRGLSDATIAMHIMGTATTASSAKTGGASANIQLDASLVSGTGVTAMSADTNLLTIVNNGSNRFIFDADGDSHQDVGTAWTNFDNMDDVAVLDALSYHVSRDHDPIKLKFSDWMLEKRDVLQAAKLVTFNEDGHHFVNMSKLTMLLTGAVRKLGEELTVARAKIVQFEQLEARIARIENGRH